MKLFCWDFHGVLERGNEFAVIEVVNHTLQKHQINTQLTLDDCEKLNGEKLYKYFEHLLPNEKPEYHTFLQDETINFVHKNPEVVKNNIQPTEYAHLVLEFLSKKHHQILISHTPQTAIPLFLESVNIQKYFSEDTIFGIEKGQKHEALKNYLQEKHFDDIIIIGDSPVDMKLKSVAGGTTYLYCHPEKEHRNCPADHYIKDLRTLLHEL